MKRNFLFDLKGFTLMEVMITVMLMVSIISMSMGSWLFMMYGQNTNAIQQELDIDVRIAMENFKNDLRLSAVDKAVFYPEGPGPYTAISFPKARDDDGDGLIDLDGNGKIIWDQTVIYHVYTGSPNQLRRTVFDPRDNSISQVARYDQLVSVVETGEGSGGNSESYPLFSNLFEWNISGKSAVFDGYSATVGRASDAILGSVLIEPGDHTLTFRSVGKNLSSSGYALGLDSLAFTPSASLREAEVQTITETIGGWSESLYMAEGSWSGNYQLLFHGDSKNDSITIQMPSDRWEETNFIGTDAYQDKTVVDFDQSLSPNDFVVSLPGGAYNWQATDQTGDTVGTLDPTGDNMSGTVIRLLVKGGQLGGAIQNDGGSPWILLRASTGGNLKIDAAYIAESAATYDNITPNTLTTGIPLEFSGGSGSSSMTLNAGEYAWVKPEAGASIEMDADKTYAVTLLVANGAALGNAPYYTNTDTNAVESFILPKTGNPTAVKAAAADWSTYSYAASPNLYIVNGTFPQRRSEGTYISPIFDTHKVAPAYQSIAWNHANGSGSGLRFKVRTGGDEGLADAPAWDSLGWITEAGSLDVSSMRYVQFLAHLTASGTGWATPRLRDVTLSWQPETKVTDIAATYATGPDKGIYELEVDGVPIIKGITASIEIYKDVPVFGGEVKRLTSAMTQEIEPRNTNH